jgi:hypothetical protein
MANFIWNMANSTKGMVLAILAWGRNSTLSKSILVYVAYESVLVAQCNGNG